MQETIDNYSRTGELVLTAVAPTVDNVHTLELLLHETGLKPPDLITQRTIDVRDLVENACSVHGKLDLDRAGSQPLVFRHCTFSNTDFMSSSQDTVTFEHCTFVLCNWHRSGRWTHLASCTFRRCTFSRTYSDYFQLGSVTDCQFYSCNMNGLMYNAPFQNNLFNECQLYRCEPDWGLLQYKQLGALFRKQRHERNMFVRCHMPDAVLINFFDGAETSCNMSFGVIYHHQQQHQHAPPGEKFQCTGKSITHFTSLLDEDPYGKSVLARIVGVDRYHEMIWWFKQN